ncbi:uncharacterized protein [Chironomus tepperi]|uniref:uncharacterized protein n=1 Tax=Chironomus tepperi TaxID=113505 RepID=UPI00391F1097
MEMKRLIPDRVRQFVDNWKKNSENHSTGSNSTNTEQITRNNNHSIRRQISDLDGVNVINIEKIIKNNGIIIDKEINGNFRRYIISILDNIAAAIELIKNSEIRDELQDNETIAEINFKFGSESIRELNSHEIWELSGRFSNKSISLCFCTKNEDSFYIYWKSKENQNFLYLNSFNDKFGWKDRKLCDFVMMFLKSSLRNGHSGISSSFSLPTDTIKIQLQFLADTRGYNLILIAAEKGDKDVVKVLLDHGINTELPNRGINAQILSYNNRQFEVLNILLMENLIYPQSIDINQCSDEIKKFYETANNLHAAIIAGNQNKSINIIVQNPKCRYFYSLKNESALKIALIYKQFKIYESLLRHGLCLAPHEDILKITNSFTEIEDNIVKNIHANSAKFLPEQHMNIIIGNTSVCQETLKSRDGFSSIYSAYQALNANILIKVILMVVAASKKFRVVFDFSRESVPTIDPNLSSKSNGFLCMTVRIFIGAIKLLKYKTKHEAYGTLAHEFCHYAVDLTFNNDAKPYFKKDNLARHEFDKINEDCKKRYGEEEVIDLVYDCYPEDMHHAELIVRVPQLLMLHKNNPEKLIKIKAKFSKLFEFFEVKVVPAMRKALPEIVNNADAEIEVNEVKVRRYPKKWNILVVFGLIVFLLMTICGLLLIKSRLFIDQPDFKFGELTDQQKQNVMHTQVSYKGVDMTFIDLLPYGSVGYDKLKSNHIRQVFKTNSLNLSEPEFSYLNSHISHNWTTLAGALKLKILSKNFTFQDKSLKFNVLHDLYPSAFLGLASNQIIDILDGKNLRISKMIEKRTGNYPHKTFVSENAYLLYYKYQIETNNTENFEEFFKRFRKENFDFFTNIYKEMSNNLQGLTFDSYVKYNLSSKVYHEPSTHINSFQITENLDRIKTFILASDMVGEKVVKMEKLADMMKKEYPTRWVAFVDMDKAVEIYNDEDHQIKNRNSILELMGRSNVTEFEQRIFDKCYESGNLVVLWNDFYHLSPDFDNFFLDLMWDLHQHSNIQLISTKTSYSQTLRSKFQVEVHRFQPLSANEKIDNSLSRILNVHIQNNQRHPRFALIVKAF